MDMRKEEIRDLEKLADMVGHFNRRYNRGIRLVE